MDNGATDLLLGEIKGQLGTMLPIVTRTEERVGNLEVAVAEIRQQIKPRRRTVTSYLKEAGAFIGSAIAGFLLAWKARGG